MNLEKRIRKFKALKRQCDSEDEFIVEVAKCSLLMKEKLDSINDAYQEALKELKICRRNNDIKYFKDKLVEALNQEDWDELVKLAQWLYDLNQPVLTHRTTCRDSGNNDHIGDKMKQILCDIVEIYTHWTCPDCGHSNTTEEDDRYICEMCDQEVEIIG